MIKNNNLNKRTNQDINIERIVPESMEAYRSHLRSVIVEQVKETGSQRGQDILDNFADSICHFWLVKPKAASMESLLNRLTKRRSIDSVL